MALNICRGCSRIDKQAEVLTDYVAKNWKPKTVAHFLLQ